MIVKRSLSGYTYFAFLLLTGLFLGNMVIVALSIVPLTYLWMSMRMSPTGGMSVSRELSDDHVSRGDVIDVSTEAILDHGHGIVVMHDDLPAHFRLEGGSNISVAWISPDDPGPRLRYSVACTRRGVYGVGRCHLELIHPCGLVQTRFLDESGSDALTVAQGCRSIDPLPLRELMSNVAVPEGTRSLVGTMTTDFKEIRDYRRGDRFNRINWKASVRHRDLERSPPLVNEYEREGRRTVWVFLDVTTGMLTGTVVDNALEEGVCLATSLAGTYLERGSEVGLVTFGRGGMIVPDHGERQRICMTRWLMGVEASDKSTFVSMVERAAGHMRGTRPLLIVISSIESAQDDRFIAGLDALSSVVPGASRMLIAIDPFDAVARDEVSEIGARLARVRAEGALRGLEDRIRIVRWKGAGT